MEISESTRGVFHLARIMGLAPYYLRKDFSNGKVEIRRSIILSIYSSALIVILVFFTYWGLLFDANSKIPIRASFRMKSATSKVVTTMDVSVVVFATFTGVICGLIGLRPTQDLNRRLKEVDETLAAYSNEAKDRFRTHILMSPMLLFITFLLGLDIWTWHRLSAEIREEHQKADEPELEEELNVQWYIPFYSLYYILTALHINFAQSAVGIGRRFRRLNMALRSSFNKDVKFNDGPIPVAIVKTISVNKSLDLLSLNIQKSQKKVSQRPESLVINEANSALLDRLAYTHGSLGRCIKNISQAFGFTVMFMLISCLLHLVATAYFLFLEFLGNRDVGFSWLQFLWIVFHLLRLLLIVEPCHVTTKEAKRTMHLICEMQRIYTENPLSENMRKFWQQLLSERYSFSACGMCKIDRQILTSFSSAITTYLVILIQFQQSTNGSSSSRRQQKPT